MNQISTKTVRHELAVAPATVGRDLALTVARIHNAVRCLTWNQFEIPAERAPTDVERVTMAGRRLDLERALTPADPRSAVSAITGMMMGFGGADTGMAPEDMLDRVQVYVQSVANEPIWAIRKACDDWRDGKHGSPSFAPSTAQFAPTVRTEANPYREELRKLTAVLEARIVGADDREGRARCFAMGMEAAAKMREAHEARRERTALRSLDALLAEAQPGMSLEERKAVLEGMRPGKGDPEARKVEREFTKAGEAFDVDQQGGP